MKWLGAWIRVAGFQRRDVAIDPGENDWPIIRLTGDRELQARLVAERDWPQVIGHEGIMNWSEVPSTCGYFKIGMAADSMIGTEQLGGKIEFCPAERVGHHCHGERQKE